MNFLIRNKYDEMVVDMPAFTKALAPLIGGKMVNNVDEDRSWRGAIQVGELSLVFTKGNGASVGRVTISAVCPDKIRQYLGYQGLPDFPSMTVDVTRPVEAIARDIKKRVIDKAAEPLDKAKAMFNEWTDITEQTRKYVYAIAEKYPKIRFSDMQASKPHNRVNFSRYDVSGGYFDGYVSADGKVCFSTLHASPDQAAAIFKILMGS